MRGKAHDTDTKAKVLAAFLLGETVTGAAKAGGVSRATARVWWRAFRKTDDYRELCAAAWGKFATKNKTGATSDAPRFDFSKLRDERYGYQGE